jgi:hypothetical protein
MLKYSKLLCYKIIRKSVSWIGAVVVMIIWWLDLQLPMQSVPITTKIVSSNPIHGEVYSIQNYVIKFVSDLLQVCGFFRVLNNKTDCHDITEILLKVALNTIKPNQNHIYLYLLFVKMKNCIEYVNILIKL